MIDSKGDKKGEDIRAEMRKKEAKDKVSDAKNDTASTRGFTTDQRIEIENLGLQKEK